jgi:uncharacterized membrane protein YkgB
MNRNSLLERYYQMDHRLVEFMRQNGTTILRLALAVVFIWFGALKVIGRTPVTELVGTTVYWVPPEFFVPFLGVWEILVGLGLLFKYALRLTLLFFWMQLAGTFLVLLLQPDIAFQGGNPLFLTVEGEFVIKNLVLIAAGLVVGSTVRKSEGG